MSYANDKILNSNNNNNHNHDHDNNGIIDWTIGLHQEQQQQQEYNTINDPLKKSLDKTGHDDDFHDENEYVHIFMYKELNVMVNDDYD